MQLRSTVLTAIAVAAATGVVGAQRPPVYTEVMLDSQKAVSEGRYLRASRLLETQAFSSDGRPVNGIPYQQWRQVHAFVAGELDPRPDFGSPAPDDAKWARRISSADAHDAIDEIVARARRTSIVILNESHDSPRDRAFALQVSRALRPLGYRTLAAETFKNDEPGADGLNSMDRLKRDGFVRRGTGFYTLDPVYAAFVRQAIAMGYEPVAYEQTSSQASAHLTVAERERDQAENLMKAIFRSRPSAKVLIFSGFGHAFETSGADGEPDRMAGWLKRLSGVDPLTIDQTVVTDFGTQARLTYAAAVGKVGRRTATFFEDGRPLVFGRAANTVDLQVVHPRRSRRMGRPEWFRALHGRAFSIPAALLPAKGSSLVQAFAIDAPADAVPIDQVLVTAGRPAPALLVSGRVRLALQSGS